MKFRDKLFKEVDDIWNKYLEHPFIKGMKTGELDKEKFKEYLIQDYLYLKEYSKVFCLGITKSNSMNEMRFLYNSISGIMKEEASHIIYMEKFGLNPKEVEKINPHKNNENYTNYMLSVGIKEGVREIAIATLACTWSYNFIAKYLKDVSKKENNFYSEWIEMYSGKSYTDCTEEWLDYIDCICKDISSEEEKRLITIFKKCSEYELDFWNIALEN